MNDYNTEQRQAWLRRLQNIDTAAPSAIDLLLAVVSLVCLVAVVGWLL